VASWNRTAVTSAQWAELRTQLGAEGRRWLQTLTRAGDISHQELNGVIGSIAHLAYHLGAIRQIDRSIRGPQAG
jgi:hypothetical protein